MATQSFDAWLNSGTPQGVSSTGASPAAPPASPQSFDEWLGTPAVTPNGAPTAAAPVAAPSPALSVPSPPQMGNGEAFVRAALRNGIFKPLDSASQLLAHGAASVANAVAPNSGVAKAIQTSSNANDATVANNEANYQSTVPNNAGAYAGAAVGTIAPFLMGTGEAGMLANGANDAALASRAANAARAVVPASQTMLPAVARVGIQAAQGAAINALTTPVTTQQPGQSFLDAKLGQAGQGALGGGLGGIAGNVAARVLSPVGSAAVTALRNAGITPTFGQLFGSAGSELEQKATSLPFVGNLINNGRANAVGQFNRALGNDALSPIGQTLPANVGAGPDMISHIQNAIGSEYDNIARNGQVVMDPALQNDVSNLQSTLATNAPGLAGRFNNIVNNQLLGKNGGNLSGDQWANTRSMINDAIRQHSGPMASSDDAQMVTALNGLQDAITSNAEHYSNTSVQSQLAQANNAYARYKALEQAAGSSAAQKNGNIFSPAQYLNATRSGQGASGRATSSGPQAYPSQQLAQTAQPLLGATVPDSGTAGRGMVGAMLALHSPVTSLKGLAAAVPYLPGIRNTLPYLASVRPAAVRAAATPVKTIAPYVGGLLNTSGGTNQQQPDPYGVIAANPGLLN